MGYLLYHVMGKRGKGNLGRQYRELEQKEKQWKEGARGFIIRVRGMNSIMASYIVMKKRGRNFRKESLGDGIVQGVKRGEGRDAMGGRCKGMKGEGKGLGFDKRQERENIGRKEDVV